jgi:Predicted membrane protein (DUF2142)
MLDFRRRSPPPAIITSPATAPAPFLHAMRAADLVQAKLQWLFLLYAVPAVVFLSIAMAPFQVADELNHVLRADQIGRGKVVSDRLGGTVDRGLVAFGALYQDMWFHPEVKQTVALAREAGAIAWSGPQDHVNFQNTAQYGPLLYPPQMIGILLGRLTDLSVAQTLVLARLVNGLASCLIGCLALAICRRGRALMFATLLLPMTLSELGSASQDALLITLSLLAVAIASRVLTEERPAHAGEFAVFALIVMATTLARPSQIALALLTPAFVTPPFVAWRDQAWGKKALIAAVAAAPIAVWMHLLATLMPPVPDNLSVSLQFEHLLADPLKLPAVMARSFITQRWWLTESVIGLLGWVDTAMPRWYYMAAVVALAFALVVPGNRGPVLRPALLAIVTVAGLVTAVCYALYLSWTPLDQPTINGLQGRYILPVLPLLAWPIPGYGARLERVLALAWYPVLLFPVVTLAVLPGVIMERYYGSWPVMAGALKAILLP